MKWECKMASGLTLQNNLRELWLTITANHVNYLREDKSPVKIRYREILQNRIKEFLYIVPHKKKFSFSKTEEVLRHSVQFEEFNALKAANAWLAISTYANNLYSQPWRKEFHEIKLYSGFYKHQVENCLWGAEAMLQLMGYKRVPESKMVLDGPVNFDRVSAVSLDALIAMCECQVIFSVFKEVSKRVVSCTWADIFRFREMYPGTVEQTIRSILSVTCYPSEYCTDCTYSYAQYREPEYRKCHEMVAAKPSHVLVPTNGYCHYYANCVHHSSTNDRMLFANKRYGHVHVPTAKLIDIDDSFEPTYSSYYPKTHCDRWSSNEARCSSYTEPYASSDNSSFYDDDVRRWQKDSRKHDNRINSRGSWEYVYKGLEDRATMEQNYKKRPSLTNHRNRTSAVAASKTTNGVVEAFGSLRLDCEANEEAIQLGDDVDGRKFWLQQRQLYDNSPFLKKLKPPEEETRSRPYSPRFVDSENSDDAKTKWECSKCTYYNQISADVCEMCGKSKNVGGEVPLISGGKHCSRCTLVNKREATKCEACDADLEGSPTYV